MKYLYTVFLILMITSCFFETELRNENEKPTTPIKVDFVDSLESIKLNLMKNSCYTFEYIEELKIDSYYESSTLAKSTDLNGLLQSTICETSEKVLESENSKLYLFRDGEKTKVWNSSDLKISNYENFTNLKFITEMEKLSLSLGKDSILVDSNFSWIFNDIDEGELFNKISYLGDTTIVGTCNPTKKDTNPLLLTKRGYLFQGCDTLKWINSAHPQDYNLINNDFQNILGTNYEAYETQLRYDSGLREYQVLIDSQFVEELDKNYAQIKDINREYYHNSELLNDIKGERKILVFADFIAWNYNHGTRYQSSKPDLMSLRVFHKDLGLLLSFEQDDYRWPAVWIDDKFQSLRIINDPELRPMLLEIFNRKHKDEYTGVSVAVDHLFSL